MIKGRVKIYFLSKGWFILIAVVFDLELIKRFRKGQRSEIVEIGACKVDLGSKEITDTFQLYIAPQSGYVSKSTRKFIHMSKEDLKTAVSFVTGIQRFAQWTRDANYLCSWGKDDRFHVLNECVRKNIKLGWFRNYNDLQQQIGKLLNTQSKNQIGLKTALELTGIESLGKAHRGIDDAINTAQLLLQFVDQIKLQQNKVTNQELLRHKQDLTAPSSPIPRGLRTRS
jgi:inhibitor of KinA sporulation pathway (predicted exonuclease)